MSKRNLSAGPGVKGVNSFYMATTSTRCKCCGAILRKELVSNRYFWCNKTCKKGYVRKKEDASRPAYRRFLAAVEYAHLGRGVEI